MNGKKLFLMLVLVVLLVVGTTLTALAEIVCDFVYLDWSATYAAALEVPDTDAVTGDDENGYVSWEVRNCRVVRVPRPKK